MKIPCFEAQLEAGDAVRRTDRLTLKHFVLSRLKSLFGRAPSDPDVTVLYYPDYLAYTTIVFDRIGRSEKEVKFVAGIDAVTGRVGEVDVALPAIESRAVPAENVVPVDVDEADAETQWDEWLFTYVDRNYRPVRRPETSLDRLELVYTPYYVVDYGADDDCYAISGLTEQVELIDDIEPLADEYRSASDRP